MDLGSWTISLDCFSRFCPDDHWSYAVKLTADTFESTIQNEIDAGKTMFVRWIASPG